MFPNFSHVTETTAMKLSSIVEYWSVASRMTSQKKFLKKAVLFGNPVQCFYEGESTTIRKRLEP